jgi:hypothetical protein
VEYRKSLGNEERGGGKEVAQTGEGSQLFGEMTGQPKPMCYPEEISCAKQADDNHWIHFRYRIDRESILVTLST